MQPVTPSCGHLRGAITPEIAAAVTKIMSNKDLILGAAKIGISLDAETPWVRLAY